MLSDTNQHMPHLGVLTFVISFNIIFLVPTLLTGYRIIQLWRRWCANPLPINLSLWKGCEFVVPLFYFRILVTVCSKDHPTVMQESSNCQLPPEEIATGPLEEDWFVLLIHTHLWWSFHYMVITNYPFQVEYIHWSKGNSCFRCIRKRTHSMRGLINLWTGWQRTYTLINVYVSIVQWRC